MVKFKNIRIPIGKTGKSRTQRVKVLASGKYKFVKNLGSKVRKSGSKTKNKPKKRSVRRTTKKKRKRGSNLQATIFKLLRTGALLAPAAKSVMDYKDNPSNMIENIIYKYTGYSQYRNKFEFAGLMEGWLPYVATSAMTHLVPKINGIIRRI